VRFFPVSFSVAVFSFFFISRICFSFFQVMAKPKSFTSLFGLLLDGNTGLFSRVTFRDCHSAFLFLWFSFFFFSCWFFSLFPCRFSFWFPVFHFPFFFLCNGFFFIRFFP